MFTNTILDTLYTDWYQIVLTINFVLGSILVGVGMTLMVASHSSETMGRVAIYMVMTGIVVILPVIELNNLLEVGIPRKGEPTIWASVTLAKIILVIGYAFQCAIYYKTIHEELGLKPKHRQFAK